MFQGQLSIFWLVPGALNQPFGEVPGMHTFEVESQTHQTPLSSRSQQAAQRELAEPQNLLLYGYEFESKYNERGQKISCELIVRPDEAKIVQMIYEWFLVHAVTANGIAKRLTEMKIPSMGDTDLGLNKKRIGYWYPNSVLGILRNKTYAGEWQYAKAKVVGVDTPEGVKQHYITRHSPEAITVKVPAIISMEMWEAAQIQLEANKKKFVKPTRFNYLLRGRIRCAKCGAAYIGCNAKGDNGKFYRYYYCKESRYRGEYKCNSGMLRADWLENEVWLAIQEALLDEQRLAKGEAQREEEAKQARRLIETSIAALDIQERKDQAKLSELLDMALNKIITRDLYISKEAEINNKIESRRQEKAELEERLKGYVILTPNQKVALRKFRQEIENRLTDNVPDEEKQKLMEILKIKVLYNYDTGEIVVNGLIGSLQRQLNSSDIQINVWCG